MSETTLKVILEELCAEKAAEFKSLNHMPHFFSRHHRNAMDKILYSQSQSSVMTPSLRRIPFRKRIIIVLMIIFLAAIGTTVVADALGSFSRRLHSDHIDIEAFDYDNAPEGFERIYYLTNIPEGFEPEGRGIAVYFYYESYYDAKNNRIIGFQQILKSKYHQTVENDNTEFEEMTIKGKNAIYTKTDDNSILIIWDSGDYIMHYVGGNVSKEDMIKLVENTKYYDL